MKPETLQQLLEYDSASGEVFRRKSHRLLLADEDGLITVYDGASKKSYRLKLDRVAYTLAYGIAPTEDQRVLHRNMQTEDNRLSNLCLVSSKVFLRVKEAYRNLSGGIKVSPHGTDQFAYIVSWYEGGQKKQRVIADVVPAKQFQLRLQLKYSKILTNYCVFDV